MAVRPNRKNAISTRPIYLPKVRSREILDAAKAGEAAEGASLRVYVDGAAVDFDVGGLAQRLGAGDAAAATGELVSILSGRPQGEVRDTVAGIANRVAWARIGDAGKQDYRTLPLRGEVDQEEARFRARPFPEYEGIRSPSPQDALYDGAEVQAAFRELLSSNGDSTAIVVTDRRIASWDASANEWTPIAVLEGDPVLVSISAGDSPPDAAALADEIGRALKG